MLERQDEKIDDHGPQEGPPFFKNWSGMYLLVIGNLVFLMFLFYLLTARYA